ncbi:hypothetical protein Tco_0972050 [Tanacetum coccineum]
MIVDIEDDIMDPVMQCTTLPSHSSFSQKKLVSFVTEIHTLSIDISLRDLLIVVIWIKHMGQQKAIHQGECEGQTAQTFHLLLPKEDSVNMGKQGLVFENQNYVKNPNILNQSKESTPSLYNIDKMGKDLLIDHKIISEEELICEAEKHLKVKQRKSPLSYHGFVYGLTRFKEPPKGSLKRREVNLKEHLEQAQLANYHPKLWNSLPMKYFCYVKQSMLNFEKQTVSKQKINRDEIFTTWNHDLDVMRKVRS